MAEVSKVNKSLIIQNPGAAVAKVTKYIVMDLTQPTTPPPPPDRKVQVMARIGER